jgi:hypothetical protein
VWWVFRECGVDLREHGIAAPISTNAFDADAVKAGWRRVPKEKTQPGDVVFYDFGDLGAGDVDGDNDHVGICSRSASGGRLWAIEGNTQSGTGGNQANGGGVFERHRQLSLVRHVYRPPYEAWSREFGSQGKAEEDDVSPEDHAKIRDEVADEIMQRFLKLGIVPSTNGDGAQIKATLVSTLSSMNRKLNTQAGVLAAVVAAVSQLSGGGVLDMAAIEAAAERGAEQGVADQFAKVSDALNT